MRHAQTALNPFTMMTDPESILQAMERSDRLNRLQRHVCRPLDRPLIPKVKASELAAYDREIDLSADEEVDGEI
ncbi:MAG TPA: hypothetical protein VFY73_29660 [Ideonella sp.]|uniref:hypothetical protein n=1 Tax=Ideonella sp. TaxID=1929293 RepID=UPI002E34CD27|nr:hypothetical protein [Ideonella sp.]HEX5688206.1 hypothetical protein [Ideonella sp.]